MRPKVLLIAVMLAAIGLGVLYALKPKTKSDSEKPTPLPVRSPLPKKQLVAKGQSVPVQSGPIKMVAPVRVSVGEKTVDRNSLTNVGPVIGQ